MGGKKIRVLSENKFKNKLVENSKKQFLNTRKFPRKHLYLFFKFEKKNELVFWLKKKLKCFYVSERKKKSNNFIHDDKSNEQ